METKIFTAKQVSADYFKNTVSYWKLLELVKGNKIPYFKVGSRILFRQDTLDRWINELEGTPFQNKKDNEVKPLKKTH